jgi:acyl-CoA thioester hydrolase
MFVVVETQLKYHRPAQLDDLLTVNASLLNKGRSSLVIAQQAWRLAGEPVLLCEGTIRIGWVQANSLKPDRIPPSILERLL